MGRIGGKAVRLTDVEIDVTTWNATVAVQSLDNNPITTSAALLISLGPRSIPDTNYTTFRSEPVLAT